MKKITLAATTLCLLAAACGRGGDPGGGEEVAEVVAPASAEDCAVASAYMTDRLGRLANKASVAVSAAVIEAATLRGVSAADLARPHDPLREDPAGWPREAPPVPLAAAFVSAPKTNALAACPDLAGVITTAGVALSAEVRPARGEGGPLRLGISLPVVNQAQDGALLVESAGAADVVVYLRKDATGVWREVDNRAFIPGFEMPDIPDAPPPITPLPAKK